MSIARPFGERPLVMAWVTPLVFATHMLDAKPQLVGLGDSAIYVDMGLSMASGHGFSVPTLPLSPETAKYPPGWPALIALVAQLGVDLHSQGGLMVLLVVNALLWALVAQITVSALVPALGGRRGAQALVGLLLAINTVTMQVVITAMSEALFAAALVGALALALRAADTEKKAPLIGLAGAVALAGLTRSVGGPLALAGLGIALAARKRSVAAAIGLGWVVQAGLTRAMRLAITPTTGDALRVLHYYVSYDEHTDYYAAPLRAGQVGELARRLLGVVTYNVSAGARSLGNLLFPADFVGAGASAHGDGLSLLGLVFLGLVSLSVWRAPRTRPILALIAVYTGIFLVWTWPFSVRFWVPVFPLLTALAVSSLLARQGVLALLAGPLVGLTLLGNAIRPFYLVKGLFSGEEAEQAGGDQAEVLGPSDTVLATARPGDVILGGQWALWLARGANAQGMELDALLPAEDRLGVMLDQVDLRADTSRLCAELVLSLDALDRALPPGAAVWVVADPQPDTAGGDRIARLSAGLLAMGRLSVVLRTEDLILLRAR